MAATPLDLIHRLLVYPPATRLRAEDALKHPWFISEGGRDVKIPVLLPEGREISRHSLVDGLGGEYSEWHGKPLGHWLNVAFKRN